MYIRIYVIYLCVYVPVFIHTYVSTVYVCVFTCVHVYVSFVLVCVCFVFVSFSVCMYVRACIFMHV